MLWKEAESPICIYWSDWKYKQKCQPFMSQSCSLIGVKSLETGMTCDVKQPMSKKNVVSWVYSVRTKRKLLSPEDTYFPFLFFNTCDILIATQSNSYCCKVSGICIKVQPFPQVTYEFSFSFTNKFLISEVEVSDEIIFSPKAVFEIRVSTVWLQSGLGHLFHVSVVLRLTRCWELSNCL